KGTAPSTSAIAATERFGPIRRVSTVANSISPPMRRRRGRHPAHELGRVAVVARAGHREDAPSIRSPLAVLVAQAASLNHRLLSLDRLDYAERVRGARFRMAGVAADADEL